MPARRGGGREWRLERTGFVLETVHLDALLVDNLPLRQRVVNVAALVALHLCSTRAKNINT